MPTLEQNTKKVKNNNTEITSIFTYIQNGCTKYSNLIAIEDTYNNIKLTYGEFLTEINLFANGLQKLGIKKGDKISLFSENNARWQIIDQAILKNGAIDAVRGSNAPIAELSYIISHSDCIGVILKDISIYKKLKKDLDNLSLNFIILMFSRKEDLQEIENSSTKIYTYEDIIKKGNNHEFRQPDINIDDIATLIYTSGTTSMPKGVMLSHGNIISQIKNLKKVFPAKAGKTKLCVLPIWHAYERTCEYYFLTNGVRLAHTNIKSIKTDMQKYKADYMMAVPRIWESIHKNIFNVINSKSKKKAELLNKAIEISTINKKSLRYLEQRLINEKNYDYLKTLQHVCIYYATLPLHLFFENVFYSKIKKQVGLTFKYIVSGGGALAAAQEDFYEAIGVNLRVAYGLTETAPILTARTLADNNFIYSAGKPIPQTQLKIVDIETMQELPLYKKGLVLAKGPQIMKGYYKNTEATNLVINKDGWFNTGDLGYLTKQNDLVLSGRMKEIIVLSNGENVEPNPLEQACLESLLINQIICIGQDKPVIGAIIVPSEIAYQKAAEETGISINDKKQLLQTPQLKDLLKTEVTTMIKSKSHFRSFEKIAKIELIGEEFSVQNNMLTQTGKLKRNIISDKYESLIEKMYK